MNSRSKGENLVEACNVDTTGTNQLADKLRFGPTCSLTAFANALSPSPPSSSVHPRSRSASRRNASSLAASASSAWMAARSAARACTVNEEARRVGERHDAREGWISMHSQYDAVTMRKMRYADDSAKTNS
eukprot:scaffold292484_cov28-Tisochrysis_lutea.AAC.2